MGNEKTEYYDYSRITEGTIDLMRSALESRKEHGPGSLVAQALARFNAECRLKTVTECALEIAEHLRKYQTAAPSEFDALLKPAGFDALLSQYRMAYLRANPPGESARAPRDLSKPYGPA